MVKTYTDQPVKKLGRVAELIKDKHPGNRARIKAKEMANASLPMSFQQDGFNVDILFGPDYDPVRGLLTVIVRVSKNGQIVYVDNPLEYVNPPIMVHDGTYHKWTDNDGIEHNGKNYQEDLAESFKQMIVQTLKVIVK